ncbi:MAG: hypothetical protein FIA99_18300 [Ruminiclostridium sp.]|nr:hypothetical protein [Ruminiclostridium sp.]
MLWGKKVIRTFLWYVLGWVYLSVTYPLLLAVKALEKSGRLKQRDVLADKASQWLSRRLFYLTGSKVRVIGQDNVPADQPVLFVSNHQSHVDSLIIHGFIKKPKGFVSIVEV